MMVSIIVPVYNVEQYLPECLSSILCQTYKDIEIILVNDGSTDRSGELCRVTAESDSRVILIEQKNAGLSAARNAGLDRVSGEYIMFVDSDDYISPYMVETMLKTIEDADMAMCRVCVTDGERKFENSIDFGHGSWSMKTFWKMYYGDFHRESVVVWNKLYKAEMFKNYRFPVGKIYEDEFMVSHLMQGNRTINMCDDILYYYRQRPDSIMSKSRTLDFPEALMVRTHIFEETGSHKLAMRTVLYALYDILLNNYTNGKDYYRSILEMGFHLKMKTPMFVIKLFRYKLKGFFS